MPGIFAQTIAFASATTAIGMAEDMSKGSSTAFARCPWRGPRSWLTARWRTPSTKQASWWCLMLAGLVVGWSVNNGLASSCWPSSCFWRSRM